MTRRRCKGAEEARGAAGDDLGRGGVQRHAKDVANAAKARCATPAEKKKAMYEKMVAAEGRDSPAQEGGRWLGA